MSTRVTSEKASPVETDRAGYRAQQIRSAAARAKKRAADSWPDGIDPALRSEAMTRINAHAAEAVTHYAGALIDQLEAKEADRLRLERRVRNRFMLVLILGIDLLAFLILIIISVIGSGNGIPHGVAGRP